MTTRALALIGGALLVTALALGSLGAAVAQTPWGAAGWGPAGMMGGLGGMMGSGYGPGGIMGGGGMMGGRSSLGGMMGGPGMMAGGDVAGGAGTPLRTLAEAEQAFQVSLTRLGTPDLALGEVMEFAQNYYAIVQERRTGNGALELLADKQTGAVFLEYGPAMMWNTRYGHMSGAGRGMMGGGGPTAGTATVTAEQAQALAQRWLDANQPGSATETPDIFPGYYTLHVTRAGQITGMLSVNATTGQVWYHGWHGAFVAASEAGH